MSNTRFRFGDGTHSSLGKMNIRMPAPHGNYVHIDVDVVIPDVPLLIGIDVLDREQLVADNVVNLLKSRLYGWEIPITRKNGHMYEEWDYKTVLFSRIELRKLHRHFHHPSSSKLLALIKRSKLKHVDNKTKQMLDEISKSCSVCQTYSTNPQRFKVSLPNDEVTFNREVALDLMWVEGKAVLHVVDIDTHFNNAIFLKGQSVEDVWEVFLSCWSTVYLGNPDKLKVDQGSAFTSVRWTKLCDKIGIEVVESGIEHHNALGSGERYHDPLRRIYKKIKLETPSMKSHISLRIAVKSIKDTLGPEGLVPSLLVFGCLPRFPSTTSNLPEQKQRIHTLYETKKEMASITSELRIQNALLKRVPRNSNLILEPGDMVRVFRETNRKYMGPFPVIRVDEKNVFVIQKDIEKQYSLHQVLKADYYEKVINGDAHLEELQEILSYFVSQKYSENEEVFNVHITEILKPNDPRANSEEARIAKKKEIDELIRRGTWKS